MPRESHLTGIKIPYKPIKHNDNHPYLSIYLSIISISVDTRENRRAISDIYKNFQF